jgi:hypothetical protein
MLLQPGVFGGRDRYDGSCPVTAVVGGREPVGPGEPGCACDFGEGARRGRVSVEHLAGPVQPDVGQHWSSVRPKSRLQTACRRRTLRPTASAISLTLTPGRW